MSALTIDQIVAHAQSLKPELAVSFRNGDQVRLCTSDIVTSIRLENGQIVQLDRVNGRYGAVYIRVSTPRQRSAVAGGDGFSDEDQLRRGIGYFVDQHQAFRIYCDAGLSGGLAYQNDYLVQRLRQAKARRYEKVISGLFLSEVARKRYTPDQISSIEESRDRKVQEILAGQSDEEVEEDLAAGQVVRAKSGRHKFVTVTYRPGLTALMQSLPSVHTVAVTDLSRLARSMLLLTDIVDNFVQHRVHVQGVVLDDLVWLSGGDEHSRIMVLLLGHLAEQRLTEVLMNTVRGLVTMLQSGKPHGILPSWISRAADGTAHLNQRTATIRHLIDLYLETGTTSRTARRLQAEAEVHPPFGQHGKGGTIWQENTVRRILVNPALIGKQEFFGLEWDTLRDCRLIDDDTWERIQSRVRFQADRFAPRPREKAYLASQLLRCHCGHKMTHRPHSSGVLQYICGAKATERLTDISYRHMTIQADTVDNFLEDLMRYDSALVLGEWQDSVERNWIRDELERMRTQVGEIDARLPEAEATAREEARQRLSAAGLAHEEVIAAAARAMIAELLGAREELQQAITERQRRLAGLLNSDELLSLEARVKRWESLSVPDRNTLLLSLFREFRFEGAAPNEYLVPVLRTLEGKELPAIQLRTTGTRTFKRRLPTVGEWVTTWGETELVRTS